MKKIRLIYILWVGLFSPICFSACGDYLDVDKYFNDMLNLDTVFSKKHYTEQWLYDIYAYMEGMNEIGNFDKTGFNQVSDDCVNPGWENGDRWELYAGGRITPSNQGWDDRWEYLYRGIRQASIFLSRVDECGELGKSQKEDYRGQARFLRAYFYWLLIKQYGPVVIMPEEGANISDSYDQLQYARAPYDTCVNFICRELVQAARVLPTERSTSMLGMATRGAALATRAKVLLYAASPLYNGNTDMSGLRDKQTGEHLISQVYDESKWARAAAAAQEVIDMGIYGLNTVEADENTLPLGIGVPTEEWPAGCGGIDPLESYRQCFNGEIPAGANKEFILIRTDGNSIVDMVWNMVPKSLNGFNSFGATMAQVDAYYMKDGYDKDDPAGHYEYTEEGFTSSASESLPLGANVSKMFANREPRFYASIAYPGTVWECSSTTEASKRNVQVFYYYGQQDNNGYDLADRGHSQWTGIGVRKFYNPEDSWDRDGVRKHRVEPTIRYADVLLWYAEALNELTAGKSYAFTSFDNQRQIAVTRDAKKMSEAFRLVRFRAGLPDLSEKVYNSQTDFRRALKRERRIEFFLESSRYFDVRRWKDGEDENTSLVGLNIWAPDSDVEGEKQKFYTRQIVNLTRLFLPKMYLWPIPITEMNRDKNMVQNPGY